MGQAVRVNWRENWKRVNFDLHRAGGFWTSLYFVVVAITWSSLIYHDAYMAGLNRITRSAARPAAPSVVTLPGSPALPLEMLVERANRVLPGGIVTVITLPQKPTAPVVVRKKMEAELHPNGRNFIYLHPQTGEVLAQESALTAPIGTRA